MIYLLYGSDFQASRKKLNEIVSEYREKYGDLNIHKFDAEENGLEKIKSVLETRSLFGAKKLAVIKYPSLCPNQDELYRVLEKVKSDPGTTTILWDRELSMPQLSELRPFCSKIQEFKEVKAWLPEESVFRLGDTFFSNRREALRSLLKLLHQGHDDFNLFSYLSNHARTLATVKHCGDRRMPVPSSSGIHPFVIKKAANTVRALEDGQLHSAMRRFLEEDFKVKTGITKPRESLFSLLLNEPRES